MFTGIIEEMGRVETFVEEGEMHRLSITAKEVMEGLTTGESVTINGACMTVLNLTENRFSCDVSPETRRLTNLGDLKSGDSVNLERAMCLNDRLGGHMVSGHVEGLGQIVSKRPSENAILMTIEVPPQVLKYCVSKGSIALDGVSMTINRISEKGLEICMIPHTAKMTTLGIKMLGESLNVESDLIGRYVARLLEGGLVRTPYAT
ncbi:MAG: riboflavin synthase [Nitrospirae bacterium]|nr:riboflavin synthase [Candidatus Manganitrophaceae bacterium]